MIEFLESLSSSGILYFFLAPILIIILIALRMNRIRIKKLTVSQKQTEQNFRELNKKLAEERVKVDRIVSVEKTKIERLLIEEKARCEKALLEGEKQKEIARIAASISNEQANKLMLFANIAEEFRTPLTLITVPIENALNGRYGKIPASLREHLEAAVGNVRHLSRLVSQFHDISRLQAGRMELKPERRNLVSFMREIVGAFQPYASKRQIDLLFQTTSESLDTYFDADKMEEVFYHLLSNAFRFTPNKGTVSVTVAEQPNENDTEDPFVEICVRDSGKGIPKAELPHLFDMLRKPDEELEAGETRIAIGLSLVRELISLHGGRIRVKSETGSGTEFQIVLPSGRSQFPEQSADDTQDPRRVAYPPGLEMPVSQRRKDDSSHRAGHRDRHILVVDDNPQIRELLKECLRDYYRVSEAEDGKSALDRVKETVPDLIISDVIMPGMDGFDLCRALKSDETYRNIPVILLTAKTSELMRVEGMDAGADDYIPKPFSPDDLLEKIKKLSSLQKAE